MRLPNTAHTSQPWRIHQLTGDFRLEDVWALPTPGGPEDFPRLVALLASNESHGSSGSSGAARTLFAIRWKLGELLGWDGPDAGHGSERPTLRDRLPADLRDAPSGPDTLHFTSLYLTDDEWAAEIVNRTVHGIKHIGWVPDQTGGYRGQMAVYVKPNGLLGTGYMAAIAPFRHLIVYPPMMREIGRDWRALAGDPTPRTRSSARRFPIPEGDAPFTSTGCPHAFEQAIDVTAGTSGYPNDQPVQTPGRVRQIAMPRAARGLSTLSRVDYEDTFLVEARPAQDRNGEQWARAILEDAPMRTRSALSVGWFALGLQLGSPRSDRFVLGWEVRRSTPDFALLGANGRLGLSAELLFERQQHTLLFATFVQLENRLARIVWAGIEHRHREVVQHVLEQARSERRPCQP